MKLNKIKNKIKKYIEENNKKVRWEVRYNNLKEKYDLALKEIELLNKKLDEDYNIQLIKDKNKYIDYLKRQRNNLREENLRLINNG
ncbi:MAG: hypothetical protein PUJ51_22135 [Clostridiales bacterium]|uniref:hypothetical protein n=1 Tax=Terrisporobacter sp. TaxID=1965305 RepID=UPI002A50F095|nr:hypothetical protein [Terrisporobacter sp.]MDD7757156.1 hypothetical protein [Clostridiales bacterium]MDY3801820.1 hypothetical protein [Bacilli bacterium]MDY4137672.1 hypothetical protein [Terrisporobacter sp.]